MRLSPILGILQIVIQQSSGFHVLKWPEIRLLAHVQDLMYDFSFPSPYGMSRKRFLFDIRSKPMGRFTRDEDFDARFSRSSIATRLELRNINQYVPPVCKVNREFTVVSACGPLWGCSCSRG